MTGRALLFSALLVVTACGGSPPPAPDAGLYHTYTEIDRGLHDLAATHSEIAAVSSIGQSIEGRELWVIRITDRVGEDEGEPSVVFIGAHHAREWISVDVPFRIAGPSPYPLEKGLVT